MITTDLHTVCLNKNRLTLKMLRGLLEDVSLLPTAQSAKEDSLFHVQGAPEQALHSLLDILQRIIDACVPHPKFVIFPITRYVSRPCCSRSGHCTNFRDQNYLRSLMSNLT